MFEVGKKVVCINTHTPRGYNQVEVTLGKTYTITHITKCACGLDLLHLTGVGKAIRFCPITEAETGFGAIFHSYRFKPLTESWVEDLLEKITSEVEIESEARNAK